MKNQLVLILFLFMVVACNNQDNKRGENLKPVQEVNFLWKADSLGKVYFEHSTMLLPVKLNQDQQESKNYYVSLFSGHNNTQIYDDYASDIGNLQKIPDSSRSFNNYEIKNISGSFGEITFESETFPVLKRPAGIPDSIVGKISLDFFSNQYVNINFKDRLIRLYDDLGGTDEVFNFQSYDLYLNQKIILPVLINNKTQRFLFNPQSALFVVFNPDNQPGPLTIGGETFSVPDTRKVNNANPEFDGIMGYAFLNNKNVIINPGKKQICISDKIPE